jgi:hypothetical protein
MLGTIGLRGLTLLFLALAVRCVLDPVGSFKDHLLDLTSASAATLAELRAYYGGTMTTMGFFLWRFGGEYEQRRKDGHMMAGMVLGCFTVVRLYSYILDGPTNNTGSDIMWTAEAIGTLFFLWLYRVDTDISPSRSR